MSEVKTKKDKFYITVSDKENDSTYSYEQKEGYTFILNQYKFGIDKRGDFSWVGTETSTGASVCWKSTKKEVIDYIVTNIKRITDCAASHTYDKIREERMRNGYI